MKKKNSGLVIAGATLALLLSLAVIDAKPTASGCNPAPPSKGTPDDPPDTRGQYKYGPGRLPGRQADAAYLGRKLVVAYQEWVDFIDGNGDESQYPRIAVTFFDEQGRQGNVVPVSDFESDSAADGRLARARPPELEAPDDLTPAGLWHVSDPSLAIDPDTGTLLVAFRYEHDDPRRFKHRYSAIAGRFLRIRDGKLQTTDAFSEPIVISSVRTGTYHERLDEVRPWRSIDEKWAYAPRAFPLSTATETFGVAYVLEHIGYRVNVRSARGVYFDSRVVVKVVTPSAETAATDSETVSENEHFHEPDRSARHRPTGITALDAAFRDTDLGKTPIPGIGWVHAVYHTDLNARTPHRRMTDEELEALGEKNLKLFSAKVDGQELVRDSSLEVDYTALPSRWTTTFPQRMGVSILLEDVVVEPRLLPIDEHMIVSYNDGDGAIASTAIRMYHLRRNDGIGYQPTRVNDSLFAPKVLLHDTVSLPGRDVMMLYAAAIEHQMPHPLIEHTSVLGASVLEYAPEHRAMKPTSRFWIEPDATSSEGMGTVVAHPDEGVSVCWPRHDGRFLDAMGGPPARWLVHTKKVVVPEAAESLFGMWLDLRHRVSPRSPDQVSLWIRSVDPSDRRFDPELGAFRYDVQIVDDSADTHWLQVLGAAPRHPLDWWNPDPEPHECTARAVLEFENGMAFFSKAVRFRVEGR